MALWKKIPDTAKRRRIYRADREGANKSGIGLLVQKTSAASNLEEGIKDRKGKGKDHLSFSPYYMEEKKGQNFHHPLHDQLQKKRKCLRGGKWGFATCSDWGGV